MKRLTVSGQVPTVHQQSVNAQQLQIYGENWANRFRRLLAGYQVSQSRLAAVIGLSAPMLSQLISGQRVKISNPAVYGRVVQLEEWLTHPAVQSGDPRELARVLDDVRASHPALTTTGLQRADAPPTAERAAPSAGGSLAAQLSTLADRNQLLATANAAAAAGAAALADALTAAADLRIG